MNKRLNPEDIASVRDGNIADTFFKMVEEVCIPFETEMPYFSMCPEEVYIECKDLLDELVAEKKNLNAIWHRKYNEYRRFDNAIDEQEIRKAVDLVFFCAIAALNSSRNPYFHDELAIMLALVLQDESSQEWNEMGDRIFDAMARHEDRMRGWLDNYKPSETNTKHKVLEITANTTGGQLACLMCTMILTKKYEYESRADFVKLLRRQYPDIINDKVEKSFIKKLEDTLRNKDISSIKDQPSLLNFAENLFAQPKKRKEARRLTELMYLELK